MSALPQALPLALSASIYPPALLVLLLFMTAPRPRGLVLAYFGGAAVLTVGAGLIALAVLDDGGLTSSDSRTASGEVYIVVGVLLLALSGWAWRRRARQPVEGGGPAGWSQRAAASRGWAFVLGLAMYLPSPLYLLAVKEISDSGDSPSSNVLAVLICALAVLLFVEIPLIALFIRPDAVGSGLQRAHRWLGRNGWTLIAVLALIAGIYAIAKGIHQLA